MIKTIYSCHSAKAKSTDKVLIEVKACADGKLQRKVTLDNIARRLNDDNRSHYEVATASITIGAGDLQELIESLQAAKVALDKYEALHPSKA